MARTFLVDAQMPYEFWTDAVLSAVYVINRLPTPTIRGVSPYVALFKRPVDYDFLRVFGSQCFPNLTPYTKHKLQPRSVRCVFVGYAPHYKAYKCLDPLTGRIYVSRHVIFHENIFPYSAIKHRSHVPVPYFSSWPPTNTLPPQTSTPPVPRSLPMPQPTTSPPHGPPASTLHQPNPTTSLLSSYPSPIYGPPSPTSTNKEESLQEESPERVFSKEVVHELRQKSFYKKENDL